MANEFRLSFTAEEIDEKLRKVDTLGGSVQSDWNQTDSSAADFIKNKPFGDMPTGGDTLYWDGNTEGLVPVDQIDTLGMVYYKLSESTPRMEDIAEGGSLSAFNTPDGDFVMDLTVEDYGGLLFCCSGMVIVIPSDNFEFDDGEGTYLSFSEKGVYFAGSGGVSFSLTIPGYTGFPVTKKIEEKYLPEPTTFYNALEDSYLYTDVNCTVKATAAELRAAMPNLLISAMGVMTYYPAFVGEIGTHVIVAAVIGTSDAMAIIGEFYTAEYVPEE